MCAGLCDNGPGPIGPIIPTLIIYDSHGNKFNSALKFCVLTRGSEKNRILFMH